MRVRSITPALLLTALATLARAQPSALTRQASQLHRMGDSGAVRIGAVQRTRASVVPFAPPALAPVLSAIVPGTGQLTLGQDRFVAYGAVELLLWVKLARDVREQKRQEAQYRDLARQVPRIHFSPVRPDGDWDYYEAMEKWLESGLFSHSQTEIRPETDRSTFNGGRWLLAQQNNGVDPDRPDPASAEYQAAIAEYARRAVGPEFLWSWRNAQLEWDLYRRTINRRNDASHAVGLDVTLLLANHMLSMVDAFTSYRLRVSSVPAADGRSRLAITGRLPRAR